MADFRQLSANIPAAKSSKSCARVSNDDRKLFLQLRNGQETLGQGQAQP
jgi:hypothetical protein